MLKIWQQPLQSTGESRWLEDFECHWHRASIYCYYLDANTNKMEMNRHHHCVLNTSFAGISSEMDLPARTFFLVTSSAIRANFGWKMVLSAGAQK